MNQNILDLILTKMQQQGYTNASLKDAESVYQQLTQNKLIQDCVSLSIHTVMENQTKTHTLIEITDNNNLPMDVLINQFTSCDVKLKSDTQLKAANTDLPHVTSVLDNFGVTYTLS